ncbi:MAG: SH3 domain-containing protein [Cellvibrionaceae bacterium]
MFLFPANKRENPLGHNSLSILIALTIFMLFFSVHSFAKEELRVIVNDTYISMHTGPGRGYPVFHVLEKGESVTLLYSKTDWIKATTEKGITGWIHRRYMSDTIGPNGEAVELGIPRRDDFSRRKWEIGTAAGAFDNAIEVIGVHGAYRFTKHVSAEIRISQATGRFSNARLISWGLVHQPFPEWRLSPFFTLGNGQIDISANSNTTQDDSKDNFFLVGTGLQYYLTHRFLARFEYNNYTTLPDDRKNGNIDEWKLGVTAFF